MITSARSRVAAFGAAALVVFAGAYGVGAATGDDDAADDEPAVHGHGDATDDADDAPSAFTLAVVAADLGAGEPSELAFRILDGDGEPLDDVDDYEVEAERPLHLILASADLASEQHLHPALGDDGVWRVDVTPDRGGRWRAIADVHPADADGKVALTADLSVAGDVTTTALPEPSTTDEVDGIRVDLDPADLEAGEEVTLNFDVTSDGEPVDLEPYLGSLGHLVVLREGDLAYLHVHPESDDELAFAATFPTAGRYRMFLETEHDSVVRTAAFTVEVDA